MAQIKKDTSLRKAILQAAVTGRLISEVKEQGGESLPLAPNVPFSATPSPRGKAPKTPQTGRQLLDRIIEERNAKLLAEWKEALKINPKAKKPAPVAASKITEDEIPFEIPENWCWCRLGDLISISSGDMLTSAKMIKGTIPVYGGNGITGYHNVANVHEETIVIGRVGFYCGSVHLTEKEAWVTDNAFITTYSKNCLNQKYLMTALGQLDLGKQQNKTAQPVVSGKKIYPILVPLPPLAVQNAIVAKLEQVLPLVDSYEDALLQKEELKASLKDKMKKAVLQEAVQGKLVPQIAGEGSAKDLLEEIKKNRTDLQISTKSAGKKSAAKKELPPITEDEIPFEIPGSWCWCRLGDLVPFGQCENAEPNEIEDNAWILDLEDIEKDSGKIIQFKTKKEVEAKSTKHVFKKGYVLYSKLRPYLNKCVVAPKDGYCTSEIIPLDFGKLVNNKYAQIFLMSPYFVDYTNSLSFGVKMPRLGTEDGKKALFPLPPLAEQKRIAAAVEDLLPLCDKLGG